MKTTILSIALLASFAAHATKPTPEPAPTPTPTATGGSAKARASARQTVIVNTTPSAAAAASASKTDNGTAGSAFGGAGGSVNGSGNGGGASVNVEASAPSVHGVASPPSPTTCDGAGVSIGGSGTKGGGLLNFGIGERESCLGAQDINTMLIAGFTRDDIQRRACQVSTIAKTPTCKRFTEQDARKAEALEAAPVAVYADPYIAARMAKQAGN